MRPPSGAATGSLAQPSLPQPPAGQTWPRLAQSAQALLRNLRPVHRQAAQGLEIVRRFEEIEIGVAEVRARQLQRGQPRQVLEFRKARRRDRGTVEVQTLEAGDLFQLF